MTVLQVCWSGGVEPIAGEWLASPNPRRVYHIARVGRLHWTPSSLRPRLALTVSRHPASAIPAGGVVHAWERTTPPDPTAPVRPIADAPNGAMRVTWREHASGPALTVWMVSCPLRRMQRAARGASGITAAHVAAADELRRLADIALIGAGGVIDLGGVRVVIASASHAPVASAMQQTRALRRLTAVLRRFTFEHRMMLVAIVLENRSLEAWIRQREDGGRRVDARADRGKLIVLLDLLSDWLSPEVKQAAAAGRLLAVA